MLRLAPIVLLAIAASFTRPATPEPITIEVSGEITQVDDLEARLESIVFGHPLSAGDRFTVTYRVDPADAQLVAPCSGICTYRGGSVPFSASLSIGSTPGAAFQADPFLSISSQFLNSDRWELGWSRVDGDNRVSANLVFSDPGGEKLLSSSDFLADPRALAWASSSLTVSVIAWPLRSRVEPPAFAEGRVLPEPGPIVFIACACLGVLTFMIVPRRH